MANTRVAPVLGDERQGRHPNLTYAVFDTGQDALLADREGGPRQVTILHTSYGRGLVEPAEDRSCPT